MNGSSHFAVPRTVGTVVLVLALDPLRVGSGLALLSIEVGFHESWFNVAFQLRVALAATHFTGRADIRATRTVGVNALKLRTFHTAWTACHDWCVVCVVGFV